MLGFANNYATLSHNYKFWNAIINFLLSSPPEKHQRSLDLIFYNLDTC